MERTAPFLVLLCFYVCAAEDQINFTVGENVTLTFKAPNNLSIIVVKCNRADLEPDYVFLYREGLLYSDEQHPSFENRVEKKDDKDVAVTLKNMTMADNGTYKCLVVQTGKNIIKNITLKFDPPGPTGGLTEDGGKKDGGKEDEGKEDRSVGLIVGLSVSAVVVLLLVAAGVVFWISRKHQEQQSQDLNSPPPQAQTQMSPSSSQLNSESPAAVPLLSGAPESRDRNDLRTDGIQQDPTNTPEVILTLEEEPLHYPQQTAGLHQEAVTSPGYEHPGCDGLMEAKGHL